MQPLPLTVNSDAVPHCATRLMRALAVAHGQRRQAVRVVFKCAAVPAAEFGGRLVRGPQEPGNQAVGVIGSAHGFVGQQEFPEFVAEVGGGWFNAADGKTLRLRVCIGVERALFAASGPKAAAAEFARIPLSHHPVRAVWGSSRMQLGGPSGKARTGESLI